jgi:DNA-3-methyladenine glycosylase II
MTREAHEVALYRRFCQAHGEHLRLPKGDPYWLFPRAEVVCDLSREQFEATGLASKRAVLRAAATSYLEDGRQWLGLSPPRLVEALRRIPGVGLWTSHVAVTDWTNDWSWYPATDPTLRKSARRAAPAYPWPTHVEAFGHRWRGLTGTHLGPATVLTLAWGYRHADHTDP